METTVTMIEARTADIESCRGFYEALGLSVKMTDGMLDDDYLAVDLGAATLQLRPASPFLPPTGSLSLTIAVDDPVERLEQALHALDMRVPAGTKVSLNVVLTDPDGRSIRLARSDAKSRDEI